LKGALLKLRKVRLVISANGRAHAMTTTKKRNDANRNRPLLYLKRHNSSSSEMVFRPNIRIAPQRAVAITAQDDTDEDLLALLQGSCRLTPAGAVVGGNVPPGRDPPNITVAIFV
jgi:hypothetical protein